VEAAPFEEVIPTARHRTVQGAMRSRQKGGNRLAKMR